MNKQNHYVHLKPHSEKQDVQQFNSLVAIVKEKKFCVAGSLEDFSQCLRLFSALLWEVDPHYEKIKMHGGVQ